MNKISEGVLALLIAASSILSAKAQQNNQQNQNEQKARTELSAMSECESRYRNKAGSCGLDKETMEFDGNYQGGSVISDNGILKWKGDFCWGVVIENGKLVYFGLIDGKREEIQNVKDKSIMDEVAMMILENRKDSKIYKAIALHSGNTPQTLKYYEANNSVGYVRYSIDENGEVTLGGHEIPEHLNSSYPGHIYQDPQGYYYIGEGMCRTLDLGHVRILANYETNSSDMLIRRCIYLDLVEHRGINSLTDGEKLFIADYKRILKKYGLKLDKDNKIVAYETMYENINTGYNR